MALETTLATEFVPGTNVKGEVAGANWSFLLPSLRMARVVCLGMPPLAALTALSHVCDEVFVVGHDAAHIRDLDRLRQRSTLARIYALAASSADIPLADASVDLIVIADRSAAHWLEQNDRPAAELLRLLKDDGLLYFEGDAALDPARPGAAISALTARLGNPRVFWVTPISGEIQTAVPISHTTAMTYAIRNKMYRRSLDVRALKPGLRSLNARVMGLFGRTSRARAQQVGSTAPDRAGDAGQETQPSQQRSTRNLPSFLYNRTQAELANVERFLRLRGLFKRALQRHSVIMGGQRDDRTDAPPRYLREIAHATGISLDQYRWGLFARGDYSSRKVLFLLFRAADETPEFIVKMTRDPALNHRLENEHRALVSLAQLSLGAHEIFPQAAFFGHHAGLAVLGETIIDGEPFEQRSDKTADCAFANTAIKSLTALGAATTDTSATTTLGAAEALGVLFYQFAQIYQPAPAEHAFLAQQIAALAQAGGAFPLVFQHGDAGTWNMLITSNDQVAFLDWEAAEPQGMPLWDLFYFIYNYGAWAARTTSAVDPLHGFVQQFLTGSPFQALLVEATRQYCERVGLRQEFVAPLYYTCWMHRALKEATRLTADKLQHGQYVNLLRTSIDHHAALQSLFSLE